MDPQSSLVCVWRELGLAREKREGERSGTGILFEEPNPTGSRPRGLIGLYKRWHQEERPQPAKRSHREEGGGDRGSTAARPTLTRNGGKKQNPTRDWGGPQVRDPVPIVSVNPEAVRERVASELYLKTQPHSLRERARVLYWNS